jgi:iron complex outermembrane receptor protein
MAQADGSPVMQPTDEGDYVAVYSYRAGDARLLGFEASADFHPIHQLHFENTFSMVDAQLLHQSSEMKYLPLTPAPKWSSELKYELFHDMRTITNSYVAVELECHLRQSHYFRAYGTETATPSYTLVNLSAGTDVLSHGGRRVASLYLSVNNLFDRGYQDHLSRLKYMDENALTGRCGVYNMGRNIALRVVVPIL